MKDYYYILGITREATAEEIKKAHRKLSLKFHPDQNQGDKFFEERFKELQEAYETLSNSDKRKIYHDNYDKFYFGYSKSKQNELNEKEKQLNALKSRLEAEKTALHNKEITLNNLIAQAEKERLLLKEQETILTNLTKQLENDKLLFAKKEKDLKTAAAQIEKEKTVLQEKAKQLDLQKNHLDAEISALRSKEAELNNLISQAQTEKVNALAKLQRNSQNAKFWTSAPAIALLALVFIVIYQFFDKKNAIETAQKVNALQQKEIDSLSEANTIASKTVLGYREAVSELQQQINSKDKQLSEKIEKQVQTPKNEISEPSKEINPVTNSLIKLGEVDFLSGSKVLDKVNQSRLDALIPTLQKNTSADIYVYGHASTRGDKTVNQKLSLDRAVIVRLYLIMKGISADKIEIVPFGSNNTSKGDNKDNPNDQRAEIFVK